MSVIMDLNEVLIFTRIVQAGSFTAAARGLGVPKSTVSRKLSELEERLDARLLQRTTRKLNLTDVGQGYFRDCERIISELEEAELSVTRALSVPRGLLRITMPLNFRFFGNIVADFLVRHPGVQVELLSTERMVNLVEEGIDLGIRPGRLTDSSLMARSLGTGHSFLVAAPAYAKAQGLPHRPADVKDHSCLVFGSGLSRRGWKLRSGRHHAEVPLHPRMVANDLEIIREAALAGVGIALLPTYHCIKDIRSGGLVRVLPEWTSAEIPTYAVYPSSRHLSPKVSVFLDFLQRALTPPPWERGERVDPPKA